MCQPKRRPPCEWRSDMERTTVTATVAMFLAAGLPACSPALDTEVPERTEQEIVAGEPARADEVKFMAAIFADGVDSDGAIESEQFCGGVFVGHNLVLTAAHCLVGTNAHLVSVGNGKRRLSDHLVDGRFKEGANGAR